MIRNKFAHFSTWAKVVEELAKSDSSVTDVETAKAFLSSNTNNPFYYATVFIKETKEIYTHGEWYCSNSGNFIFIPELDSSYNYNGIDDAKQNKKHIIGIIDDTFYYNSECYKTSDNSYTVIFYTFKNDGNNLFPISAMSYIVTPTSVLLDRINNLGLTTSGSGYGLLSNDGSYKTLKTINGQEIFGTGDLYIESGETLTEADILAMGFTKNTGTITGVKMNGASKGTSGVVDLGTVITEHQDISGKQDVITDLATIRDGASKGATALQSVPSEYVTETELTNKGYATTSALDNKVDKITGKQLSTEDFTSALKTKLEGLSNYDDTELTNALSTLRGDFDKLVSGDTTTAIKTFNEVIAFLDGLTDTQDLESIIASIEQQIAGKADNSSVVHISGEETITGVKTFNGRVNFLGSGDSNAMYLSTNTRLNVNGTTNTVLGFSSGTFLINNAAYDLTLRGKGARPAYNSTTLALSSDIPAAVTENTVLGWGFTKNAGTITGISANGTSVATSGVANIPAASTSQYGVTKLSSATNSTSTSLAATPSAVKAAYDLANGKVSESDIFEDKNMGIVKAEALYNSESQGALIYALPTSRLAEEWDCDDILTSHSQIFYGAAQNQIHKVEGFNDANSQDLIYALPNTRLADSGDYDEILATQSYVESAVANVGGAYNLTSLTKAQLDSFTSGSTITINAADVSAIRANKIITITSNSGRCLMTAWSAQSSSVVQLTFLCDNVVYIAKASLQSNGTAKINEVSKHLVGANSGVGSDANVQAVDTGDVIDDVTVNYATTSYVDGLVGDINSILESIINGSISLISFTINGTVCQAEQGMTFYDWAISDYYNANAGVCGPNGQPLNGYCTEYSKDEIGGQTAISTGYISFSPSIVITSIIPDGATYSSSMKD